MSKHINIKMKLRLINWPYRWWETIKKYNKTIWTKIEDLKDTKLNAFPVYDDRYIKTNVRMYDDKVFLV